MGDAAFFDFCLRLAQQGLDTVWWPYTEFITLSENINPCLANQNTTFSKRWQNHLSRVNRNLKIIDGDWSLISDLHTAKC